MEKRDGKNEDKSFMETTHYRKYFKNHRP